MYGQPSCTSASMARTTCGLSRRATIFISRKKRETARSLACLGEHDLQGDHAIHQAMSRLENAAAAALAYAVDQRIAAKAKDFFPREAGGPETP